MRIAKVAQDDNMMVLSICSTARLRRVECIELGGRQFLPFCGSSGWSLLL